MSAPALQLDFRRAPASPWRWVGWAALPIAALAGAAAADEQAVARDREAAAREHRDALEARLQATAPRRAAPPDAGALVLLKQANMVIEQLAVPWDDLFDAMEAADARGLAVLSMTPSARDRSLRMAGEARSLGDVLAYAGRLSAQPVLSQVHLLGYSTVARDRVTVVTFTLGATWRVQQP
jgi:hypothetical protein